MKKSLPLLFSCFISVALFGGNDNYPLGGRSAGMGHASVALGGDLWSVHNNQAGLAWVNTIQGGFYYENRFLVKELGMKAGAVVLPIRQGTFGLEVSSFGFSQYGENKYGLSFARKFGTRVAAGIQLDYLTTRIAGEYGSVGAPAAEIGVMAEPVSHLRIGVHIFNPTRAKLADYNDERVPTLMRFGGQYTFSEKVFLSAELEKDVDFKAVFRGGIEYHPVKEFYLRAGAASNPGLSAFGFGVELKQFRLDLASTFHSVLGFTPQVSLQYGINKK